MLSAIQMHKHEFAEISLKPNADLAPGKREGCAVSIRHQFKASPTNKEETLWVARLRIEIVPPDNGNTAIYTGAIEVVGQFEIHPDITKSEQIKYACINGGALLFGAAREMTATLSSRSIHGLIELPSIDPRVFLPQEAQTTARQSVKKSAKSRI